VPAVYKAADERYHESHNIFASPSKSCAEVVTISSFEFPYFVISYIIQLPFWAAVSILAYFDDYIALCRPEVVAYTRYCS
jgi:hypothetical protein